MKNLFLLSLIITGATTFFSCSEFDNRISITHDYLKEKIATDSKGAFRLDSFEKTNGYDDNLMGHSFYVLEWQGVISVQAECWQDAGSLERFSVIAGAVPKNSSYPSNLATYYPKGGKVQYVGNCYLIKTEKGWRVEHVEVKQRNILSAQAYNTLGKSYFDQSMAVGLSKAKQQDLTQKAILTFNNGLTFPDIIPETKAELLINRGAAQASMGKFNEALADLNEGVSADPKNKNGYLNRSLVYFNLKQFENAISDYSKYLQFDPKNANVWYERGMLRRTLEHSSDALSDLEMALKLNPNLGIAYLERARAKAQLGDKPGAQQDYHQAEQFGLKMEDYDRGLMAK